MKITSWMSFALLSWSAAAWGHGHHHHHHYEDEHEHEEEAVLLFNDDQIKELGIEIKEAGPGNLSTTISTRGKIILHPDNLAHIIPKIPGVAKEAKKNIGDRVKEGDLLAVLESHDMAEIKANFLAAKEKKNLALSLMEREKLLHEKKVSAEQDYFHARSAYAEARINYQLAKQKLHAFGIDENEINDLSKVQDPDLKQYEIRSPMDGIVIARHINKGEYIDNTTTIYEIADLSTVWIEIGVYPKDLAKVKEGQTIDISSAIDGAKDKAKIIYLSPIIEEETITAKAIAELKNPTGQWRPGSYIKVNISTASTAANLLIPKTAVQDIEGVTYVFVKTHEGFEKREARLGKDDNDSIEIISGLSPGEKYASSNTFILKADLGKGEAEHEH